MNKRVGAGIKRLRLQEGLSQLALSERVSLSRSTVANIEAGRQAVSLSLIINFSSAFKITPQAFMKGLWFAEERATNIN